MEQADGRGGTVKLEYYSWLCRELGVGTGSTAVEEHRFPAGWTVRSLLERLAEGSEAFRRLAYDPAEGRLKEYVTLVRNGRLVELAGGLDDPLRDGDHLLLLPGFSGGSAGRASARRG